MRSYEDRHLRLWNMTAWKKFGLLFYGFSLLPYGFESGCLSSGHGLKIALFPSVA